MKNDFEAIDLSALATVTGGEDKPSNVFGPGAGPNREEYQGQLDVQTPMVKVSGQGAARSAYSDVGMCLKAGNKPADCAVFKSGAPQQ